MLRLRRQRLHHRPVLPAEGAPAVGRGGVSGRPRPLDTCRGCPCAGALGLIPKDHAAAGEDRQIARFAADLSQFPRARHGLAEPAATGHGGGRTGTSKPAIAAALVLLADASPPVRAEKNAPGHWQPAATCPVARIGQPDDGWHRFRHRHQRQGPGHREDIERQPIEALPRRRRGKHADLPVRGTSSSRYPVRPMWRGGRRGTPGENLGPTRCPKPLSRWSGPSTRAGA